MHDGDRYPKTAPPASRRMTGPTVRAAHGSDVATDGAAVDEQIILRIANVPRDVGWLMISVGVIGGRPAWDHRHYRSWSPGLPVLAPGGPTAVDRLGQTQTKGCHARRLEADRPMAR